MTDYHYAAQRLLENPAVTRAFDEMRQDIKDAWAATPANDVGRMVGLRHELAAIDALQSKLEGYVFELVANPPPT